MKILKLSFAAILFIYNSFCLNARTRNADEASQIAHNFLQSSTATFSKAPLSPDLIKAVQPFNIQNNTSDSSTENYFHIFNIGSNNGFVIVSATDRVKTILGYADTGNFNPENIPVNMLNWLKVYANEIAAVSILPENEVPQTKISVANNINTGFAAAVLPLLKNIKWNQNAPYNNLCPVINTSTNEKAVTGCGATAMAQVMKYFNWPVSGTGSKTYTTKTLQIPLTVDFSSVQYDWANMTGTYNSSSTELQNTAVATLMYHCGVAVNMDYNKSSSAYTTDIAKGLINYFGYDSNIQVYQKNYFSKAEWENFMKIELNAARPILYNGQASDGGHIFVCDGYDTNGLYHFNWGWGGISDGYFELSALNPNELGIGGGNSGGYNVDQYMITGIQKPPFSSVPSYLIYTNMPLSCSASQIARTGTFNIVTQKIYNYGINTITGSMGLGLYNGNTLVQLLYSTNIKLDSFYGWSSYTFSNMSIPTGVAAGNYKIYVIYKPNTSSVWSPVRGKIGTPNFLNVTVDASSVKFSEPTDVYPVLTLNSLNKTNNLYQNKTGRFSASISNSGNDYNSLLRIYLESVTNPEINQIVITDPVNIATGETKEFYFNDSIKLVPGTYKLALMYDKGNNSATMTTMYQLGESVNVDILAQPAQAPLLSLVNTISFPDPDKIYKSNATLNATIKNTGGYFDGKLIAFIFPVSTGSSIAYIGHQSGIIDMNQSVTFSFSGGISLDPNNYRIGVYYLNSSNSWTRISPSNYSLITFNLKDDLTAFKINEYEQGILYPNPATDIINLKTDQNVKSIKISDIAGREVKRMVSTNNGIISVDVSNLPHGTYFVTVQTDQNQKINKFIKK